MPVSEDGTIRAIKDSWKRQKAQPRKKKEPITPKILREMVGSLGTPPSLSELRLASICLLAFAAFLRIGEVQAIRCCDVKFTEEGMEIYIAKSKTDQYRQGNTVPIARTKNPTCPVMMLVKYFTTGEMAASSKQCLFRLITMTKLKQKLRGAGPLSYTRIRELVLAKLKSLGYDKTKFGLHSFRAGGASSAANNGELPDRLFKRHGRWRSENVKDGYIEDSLETRLRVSRSLGL